MGNETLSREEAVRWNAVDERFKIDLLSSIGDEKRTKEVLLWVMEKTGAEVCAVYARKDADYLYIIFESEELIGRIEQIRKKLTRSFLMFSNESGNYGRVVEKVFYRSDKRDISFLFNGVRLESYFFTPIVFDSRIHGVLYVASVRKEAFTRRIISEFATLADEGIDGVRLIVGTGEEELLSNIVNSFPFGAAIVESNGKFTISNKRFKDVMSMEGEVESVDDVGKVSPFNLNSVWEEHRLLRRSILHRKLKGVCVPEKFIEVSIVNIKGVTSGSSSLVIVNDVTDVMSVNGDTEELIASVAHELRTPLTALKNSLTVMRDVLEKEELTAQKKDGLIRFASTATRTVDRLGRLVNGLIDSSFINEDEDDLEIEKVELRTFIDDALSIFRESIAKREINLSVKISEKLKTVFIDIDRMEQIVQNLISNSLKNVTSGGEISVSAEVVKPSDNMMFSDIPFELLRDIKFLRITISNTGHSIPEEVSDRINSPDRNIKPRVRSTHGLGLHIARKLTYKHAGFLRVDSVPDFGTRVYVYIPFDYDAREVVKNLRFIKRVVESKAESGSMFILYVIMKQSNRCWLEIAGNWEMVPVVNPVDEEFVKGGFFLWPIGNMYAIAVATEEEILGSPMSIFRNSYGSLRVLDGTAGDFIKVGWAICPIDGMRFRELVEVSRSKLQKVGVAT